MAVRTFILSGGIAVALGIHAAPPDPLDPQAVVPAPVYRSALDGYRRHSDAKPTPWRQANDTVERIGGWRTYAREANAPAPGASAAAPATRSTTPLGDGGHKP